LLIELGVAFDLIVLVTVAVAFHQRIFGEFGTGDTGVLRICMSDLRTIVALAVPAVPLACGSLLQLARSPRSQDWANRVAAVLTAVVALGAVTLALAGIGQDSGKRLDDPGCSGRALLGRYRLGRAW